MASFIVKGTFKMGDFKHKFSKKVTAVNENLAKENVKSKIGADYRCPRHLVKIESVEVSKK
jgi:ribosomal protein L20A (L18A)